MSLSKVRSAIAEVLKTQNFIVDADTAWENVKFDPGTKKLWYKFTFVPVEPRVFTLGPASGGGKDEQKGFAQLDINVPINSGDKIPMDKYTAIRSYLAAGTKLAYQSQEVIISSVGRSQGRQIDGYYRVSVTIMFRAFINR